MPTTPIKVLTVFGTRPEAVKMAPVIKALKSDPLFDTTVCITAQHRQMLDQVLALFEIQPDIDLDLMVPNQTLTDLTGLILNKLDPFLTKLQPDWLLVQGDTTSVMATSLLGYYHKIKTGHIEAGLRTYDKWQPFPEEINRRIAGIVADLHFAPTEHNRQNLLRENIPDSIIRVTGNTVIDALQSVQDLPLTPQVQNILNRAGNRKLIVLTAHRRENLGSPLEVIFSTVKALAQKYPDLYFVDPVHLNPHVRLPAEKILFDVPNVQLISPMDYLPMIQLIKHARLVLTDSGGIQEEATALGIPTLVLRNVTERPEGVEAGILKLVGSDQTRIMQEMERLLTDTDYYASMANVKNPFGDGKASQRILKALKDDMQRIPENGIS